MLDISQLNYMLVPELRELADQLGLKGYKRLNKQELIYKILDHQAAAGDANGSTAKKEEQPSEEKETKPKRTTRKGRGQRTTAEKKTTREVKEPKEKSDKTYSPSRSKNRRRRTGNSSC